MNTKFAFKSEMNTDDAEAVIENPKLSRMSEEPPRASRAGPSGRCLKFT